MNEPFQLSQSKMSVLSWRVHLSSGRDAYASAMSHQHGPTSAGRNAGLTWRGACGRGSELALMIKTIVIASRASEAILKLDFSLDNGVTV